MKVLVNAVLSAAIVPVDTSCHLLVFEQLTLHEATGDVAHPTILDALAVIAQVGAPQRVNDAQQRQQRPEVEPYSERHRVDCSALLHALLL